MKYDQVNPVANGSGLPYTVVVSFEGVNGNMSNATSNASTTFLQSNATTNSNDSSSVALRAVGGFDASRDVLVLVHQVDLTDYPLRNDTFGAVTPKMTVWVGEEVRKMADTMQVELPVGLRFVDRILLMYGVFELKAYWWNKTAGEWQDSVIAWHKYYPTKLVARMEVPTSVFQDQQQQGRLSQSIVQRRLMQKQQQQQQMLDIQWESIPYGQYEDDPLTVQNIVQQQEELGGRRVMSDPVELIVLIAVPPKQEEKGSGMSTGVLVAVIVLVVVVVVVAVVWIVRRNQKKNTQVSGITGARIDQMFNVPIRYSARYPA